MMVRIRNNGYTITRETASAFVYVWFLFLALTGKLK